MRCKTEANEPLRSITPVRPFSVEIQDVGRKIPGQSDLQVSMMSRISAMIVDARPRTMTGESSEQHHHWSRGINVPLRGVGSAIEGQVRKRPTCVRDEVENSGL